jgi:lipopolysaccharide transport system permease protein
MRTEGSVSSRTIIRPNQRGLALAEAYARRELLYFLIWRDISIRYRQTLLGVAWAVLVPVIQLVIFTVIFGRFAGIQPDGNYPYPLFVLAALVPWNFFSQSVAQGGQSLVSQQEVIKKVYFPRLFVPTGSVAGNCVDLLISFGVYAALLAWYRYIPSWQTIFVPLLAAWTLLVSLGATYLLSALTVAYRDFRYITPLLIQSLLFLSPIFYPVTIIPERYRWLLALNPMAGIIDAFRSAILGKPWDVPTLLTSMVVTVLLLAIGLWYFRENERRFADIA